MNVMGDLNFVSATKSQLWQLLKAERTGNRPPEEDCTGICSDKARRHLSYGSRGWTFREGKKPLGVGGTPVTFCPFCGRKLQ